MTPHRRLRLLGFAASLLMLLPGLQCSEPGTDEGLSAPEDPRYLAFFEEDYVASRDAFRAEARDLAAKFRGTRMESIARPAQDDATLTIDAFYVPAQRTPRGLVFVTSGLHGAEGLAGAAVQRYMMKELLTPELVAETGFLFVHAVNPYGVQRFRRVTENNVDLNRNCDRDPALFQNQNPGYRAVNELLNPEGPVDLDSWSNRLFAARAVYNIATTGMKALRQAVLQGQYEYSRGVYFGGSAPESNHQSIADLLDATARGYRAVLLLDLHTGFGERGKLHLFPDEADAATRTATETVFAGHPIDWPAKEDFYSVTGSFSVCVGQMLPEKTTYIPMVLEYGTLDSQTTGGSIESIRRVILENQGFHFGFASESDAERTQRLYREMFFPSSGKWRTRILADTGALLQSALPAFADYARAL